MKKDVKIFLDNICKAAVNLKDSDIKISDTFKQYINEIVKNSENNKGVFTVVITSLVYKHFNPAQDVRNHQQSIPNGYSGRTFDNHYITPYLRENKFPCMAESGWLTRSLEQKVPYDAKYTGAINPQNLKNAFLGIFEQIEVKKENCDDALKFIFKKAIELRDKNNFSISIPQNIPISNIIELLDSHFHSNYNSKGASRLPVLALYAIYMVISKEMKRFEKKQLLKLENHNSADLQSGCSGDININDENNDPFESVEVKFDIPISNEIVQIAKDKILATTTIKRYYILSTKDIIDNDKKEIEQSILQIKNIHGCQLVINGVLHTIKYYLRLIEDTNIFLKNYTELLKTDTTIKSEHKLKWNEIVANFGR
ncbi:MAG: hypothetical protein PUC42_01520 [Bacteroidales bacterium]|nr:hypothetical protein [Bacteroidales bacterium]